MQRVIRVFSVVLVIAAIFGLTSSSYATVLVSNVWNTGVRTYPASNDPNSPYSEMGTDYNSSGDLESAWFGSNVGSLTASVGDMRAAIPVNSLSFYTYFTSNNAPVTLSNVGDELKLTWVFTPNGTIAVNGNQGFNLALALTPNASRVTADAAVPQANYTNGFAMFMNMSATMANANSFQLKKWSLAGSGNLLGTSANWASLTNGVAQNSTGYFVGTQYTFVFDLKLTAGGLQVVSSMAGDNIGGTGSITDTYLDPSISSVSYDTFDIRPSGVNSGASQIDTSLFMVEVTSIPEPSTLVLVCAGFGLMVGLIRRRR